MQSKPEIFFWQWRDYAPQSDRLMNRARAARLLRAWRRAKIQGYRVFTLERVSAGHYRVMYNASGERGAMILQRN